ncbi:unnamed protein product [Caenorhabditis bovis]|uniref:Methyltransferase domain-containing protein n=1 Tax=Caenorhabditis bovis TaxID=2654633 RepID=A0A8S1EII7_9PELO|nr:unnamed protein product [Caenorhabditis bovis]
MYIFILPPSVLIDENYGQVQDDNLVLERVDYKYSKIAQECSSVTDVCYVVMDKKLDTENGEIVERHMFVKGFETDSDTVVRLVPPQKEKTFENSDTRIWKVDHKTIRAQYVSALVCAPFIVSTLSLVHEDNNDKSVLEIGLGGGSLDMFLHELNPNMKITALEIDPVVVKLSKKWFDVVDDKQRKTVISDGAKFIEKTAKKNEKFDVVILDACDSSNEFPCPAKIFREPHIISKLSSIMTDNGVLVINMLSYNDNETDNSMKLFETLTEHFGSCLRMTVKEEINVIAICTHQYISDNSASVEFLKKRASAVTMNLGMQDNLNNIAFV